MDLHKMECFIKVYEELNLSKAAQKLFITQQGLSRIIMSMEADLAVKLFIRNTSGLTPTKFGNSFYHYACSMVSNFQYAQLELSKIKNSNHEKVLHVGVSDGVFPAINLSQSLCKFKEKYPEIQIVLISKPDLISKELLFTGEIDCSFQVGMITESNLQSTLLHQEPIYAWISKKHPLSAKNHISLEDLIAQPLIMVDDQYTYRKVLNQWYNNKGLTSNIKYMTNDIITIYYLAAQNEGIALHPEYWQRLLVKNNDLVDLPVTDIDYSTWQVSLCRSNHPMTNVSEKLFIEFMINYYVNQQFHDKI